MTAQDTTAALQRARAVYRRRPQLGEHDDAPATSCWNGGLRVLTRHANGTELSSDMATELGGSGDRITPGWLFRAGLASCATTTIALCAALDGIELTALEVLASSRSDTRGLLGMTDDGGERVHAGPHDVQMTVRIAAAGVSAQRLRALVDEAYRCSPVPNAVQGALPIELVVNIEA